MRASRNLRGGSDTSKRLLELVRKARAIGWRVEACDKGWRVYPPDKDFGAITVHYSVSDVKAYANTRARFRRAGLDV